MFKTTHKRRATTLSKTLLTAGLLGGAALSTLSAGSAQAAWDLHNPFGYICTIAPTLGGAACEKAPAPGATTPTTVKRTTPQPIPPDTGKTSYPHDKLLTLLNWVDLRADDTIAFTIQEAGPEPKWELDLDFSVDRVAGDSGSLDYKIEITDPGRYFKDAQLSSFLSQIPAVPVGPFEVTKSIYSDAGFSNLLLKLTNNEQPPVAGTLVASGLIDPNIKTIYVRDEWSIPVGSITTIDAIQNNYTQVPAPLPLLGVGAAFGSIRKLRKFSSQLKTFSMG
jgi:hypothetical protein